MTMPAAGTTDLRGRFPGDVVEIVEIAVKRDAGLQSRAKRIGAVRCGAGR